MLNLNDEIIGDTGRSLSKLNSHDGLHGGWAGGDCGSGRELTGKDKLTGEADFGGRESGKADDGRAMVAVGARLNAVGVTRVVGLGWKGLDRAGAVGRAGGGIRRVSE